MMRIFATVTKMLFVTVTFLSSAFAADSYTVNLEGVRFADLVRVVYGDILKRSYTLDRDLVDSPDTVAVSWQKLRRVQVESLMHELAQNRGFSISQRSGAVFVERRDVAADEEILIYAPRYRSSRYLSDIVANVTGARLLQKRGVKNNVTVTQKAQEFESATSANSLLDRADSGQIVLVVARDEVKKVTKLLADLDTSAGEVVLKAAVYEVGSTRGEGGAVQVAASLVRRHLNADIGATIAGSNTLGYVNGGLDVVLSVLDKDSRFKTVSRPMVRVRSGAQARFSVGQDVPVLGQASLDKNGNPVQSVDYRQSGVILSVIPDIRADVIDLDISQELSSFVATTTGVNNSPTLLKRSVNSKLSIKSGEVVIFAGLNESKSDEVESRLFGLKLSGQSSGSDTEILVFVEALQI